MALSRYGGKFCKKYHTSLVSEEARDGTDEHVVDRDADDGIEKADPSTELSSWSHLPVSNSSD